MTTLSVPDMSCNHCKMTVEAALAAAGLKLKDGGKTEYLLFLGEREVTAFAALVDQHWDTLGSTEKKSKKDAKSSLPKEVIEKTAAKYQEALTRLMG